MKGTVPVLFAGANWKWWDASDITGGPLQPRFFERLSLCARALGSDRGMAQGVTAIAV